MDTLFLVQPDFEDPAYPGLRFYCWHCALIEGVVASFPWLNERVSIVRVAWPRPRQDVIDAVGEENQDLPLLLLGEEGGRFIKGKDAILAALTERHGVPTPHP